MPDMQERLSIIEFVDPQMSDRFWASWGNGKVSWIAMLVLNSAPGLE